VPLYLASGTSTIQYQHQVIWPQADLNTCIALPTLCTPGAAQAEPAQVSSGCVLNVDAGVQSFPVSSIPLPFPKGTAQFSLPLSALQTWGLSGAEILCAFASTKPTRQTPPQLARTETNTDEM